MKRSGLIIAALLIVSVNAFAQGQPSDPRRTPGVQAGQDPKRPAFVMANCKNPAPAPAPAGPPPAGAARGAAPSQEYTVAGIPNVIASRQHWKAVWQDTGNNADGIVGMDDGSLLLAQNSKSDVVRIDKNGKASVIYTDTYTGGALAANSRGQVFIAERALPRSIWLLKPQRKLFADMYMGQPMECLGAAVLNDLAADSKGGVYMTMGGVYYANPQGVVMGRFGTVGGNGIILSPDGKTLYVTGRVAGAQGAARGAVGPGAAGGLVAFDVQPDGSLTNERQFADTCGDGSAVDSAGRIYCTGARITDPKDPAKMIAGVGVISPKGELLGIIQAPRNLISVAFGGPNKKTLFGVAINDVQLLSIPMLTQGYKGRPK